MDIYNEKEIIHYPSLRTMLMVEKALKDADTMIDREELKRRLPTKIMHQTLNLILKYLEDKGMIIDSHKGILWIYNPSPKLRLQKSEISDSAQKQKVFLTKAIENARNNYKRNLNKIKPNKNMNKDIEQIKAIILSVIKRFNVARAGIFGSYARGEADKDSDIDILIEFKGRKSLFDLINLEIILKKALKRKVDLLTYNSINPLLKERILKEEVRIL